MQTIAALLLVLLAVPASAAVLRGHSSSEADPVKPAAIKAKWDDMDDFVGAIFTMACKEKNGKDIAGLAAEKLKEGKLDGKKGYIAEVKKLEAASVGGLKRSCGMMVAEGTKTCREGCATSWNAKSAFQRDNCDDKCVKVYQNFERSCKDKVDNLGMVYDAKREKEAAQDLCYRGHCSEFPSVWMKEDAAGMQTRVDEVCGAKCTSTEGAAHLEKVCEGKWAEKVGDRKAEHKSTCSESTTAKTCMATKTATISGEYDTCKSTKDGTCDTDFDTCKTKGKTDNTFKDAEKFCTDRHKMCKEQTNEACSKDQKASLEKGKTDCEKDHADALKTCVDQALSAEKTTDLAACKTEDGTACTTGCEGGCQVGKMTTCLEHVKSDHVVPMFCEDFWHLLHTSSEVDPVTGNPITLLSQKGRLTFA